MKWLLVLLLATGDVEVQEVALADCARYIAAVAGGGTPAIEIDGGDVPIVTAVCAPEVPARVLEREMRLDLRGPQG